MADWNGFRGLAKRLDDIDLPREGHEIGVGEDILHAFIDTESRGWGFDGQGRPIILFEPHVFYRNLSGAKRAAAVKAGLAYPKWGTKPYGKESEQYGKLERAMQIDETAALKAVSMGMFQVLGENFAMVGFASPQAMMRAMMEDEEVHLRAAIRFCVAAGIDDDLRRLDAILKKRDITPDECRPVVSAYNGKGYEKNKYHIKFATNANKWRRIKDTPWSPADAAVAFDKAVDAGIMTPAERAAMAAPADPYGHLYDGKAHEELRAVQTQLNDKGWPEVGSLDGKWAPGGKTSAAILSFKSYVGLPTETDKLTPEMLAALSVFPVGGRKVAAERAEATVEDLREKGVVEVQKLDIQSQVSKVLVGAGALTTAAEAVDRLGAYSDLMAKAARYIDPIKNFVTDNTGLVLLGVGGFGLWQAWKLIEIRLQKHRTAEDVSA